jgi:hypothetical protein
MVEELTCRVAMRINVGETMASKDIEYLQKPHEGGFPTASSPKQKEVLNVGERAREFPRAQLCPLLIEHALRALHVPGQVISGDVIDDGAELHNGGYTHAPPRPLPLPTFFRATLLRRVAFELLPQTYGGSIVIFFLFTIRSSGRTHSGGMPSLGISGVPVGR